MYKEPRRVPGRYVVYLIIFFAILCAAFTTWGIRAMKKLPRPPGKTGTSPFG